MTSSNGFAFTWSVDLAGSSDTSVRQRTIAALRQAILTFQLKPGQRLIEREFIERLGVSRTTFREALRELAAEGLITVVPQKGASVSVPSFEEATDLYELRAALESIVVTRFVERASDAQIDALDSALAGYRRVAERTTDILSLLSAKESFYEVLVEGASSNALQQILEGIKARVQALRATSLSRPGRATETVAELGAIVAAVRGRDAATASRLCQEHVRNAARTALASLAEAESATS